MTKYLTKEQVINAMEEQNLMLDDIWGVEQRLDELPAADVAPVVHATTTDAGWDEIYCQWKTCNRCQGDNVSTAIYCNWCGARMDGGKSNAD